MTASETAKAAGLKNLMEVARITGQSTETLNNWHNNKPDLYRIVIRGCSEEVYDEIKAARSLRLAAQGFL